MEYLILNESSLPFININDLNKYLPVFFKVLSKAFETGMSTIRLDTLGSGWFEIPVTDEMVLREWLKYQGKDIQRFVKSLIDKTRTPFVPEDEQLISERWILSDFYLEGEQDCKVPALGACFYLKQLSVSVNSNAKWNKEVLKIRGHELTVDGDVPLSGEVSNCTAIGHWEYHSKLIENSRKQRLRQGNELWENREKVFPNIVFCGKTEAVLTNFSYSDILYRQMYDVITKLNAYCVEREYFSLPDIREFTGLDMVDESDTTKNMPKLKRRRSFMVNGKSEFFGLHVRNFSNKFRLHFFPVKEERKIYVGYFGPHLDLRR